MNSTTALPPKALPARCTVCGLAARAPIVVAIGKSEGKLVPGRCSNRAACEQRARRNANRAKASS